jgi:hypothetical protein
MFAVGVHREHAKPKGVAKVTNASNEAVTVDSTVRITRLGSLFAKREHDSSRAVVSAHPSRKTSP